MARRTAHLLVAALWLLIVLTGLTAFALATLGFTWSLAAGATITAILGLLFLVMYGVWFLWW